MKKQLDVSEQDYKNEQFAYEVEDKWIRDIISPSQYTPSLIPLRSYSRHFWFKVKGIIKRFFNNPYKISRRDKPPKGFDSWEGVTNYSIMRRTKADD